MADGRLHNLNLEELLGMPGVAAPAPAAGTMVAAALAARIDLSRRRYPAREFLNLPSAEFVACAYTALFRKAPDPATFVALRDQLLLGQTSRIAMLEILRKSAAADGSNARLSGLLWVRLRHGFGHSLFSRSLRALARLVRNLRRLPKNIRQFVARVERLERLAAGLKISGAVAQQAEADRLLSSFYGGFEDQFRGEPGDIKARQTVYLPRIRACIAATDKWPVVDLGFGRGEWLELLGENGIDAIGYDSNMASVRACRARGLDVRMGDALTALRECPTESVSVVTAFHVIEHVPFDVLIQLVDECLRVLRPGGLILFETPNPANLLVAAERFYLDPTHRNPLPAEMIAYLVASRGFKNTEILRLHPVPWEARAYDDPMLALLQEKLFGAQDYSVVGYKP